MEQLSLTISIVLYQNDIIEIENLMRCINKIKISYRLFLIDNSPSDKLRIFSKEKNTAYHFNNRNLGFGPAQNLGINEAIHNSKYHLILNPDIIFEPGTIENIYEFMENNSDIGQLMPKIFYPDGKIQKLCKLLPHPVDLIGRRFLGTLKFSQKRNDAYELSSFSYDKLLDIPNLSGCFMFIRTSILEIVGGFDTRFFMYLEDADLTRRINKISRTVFYPEVGITHAYHRGSYSSSRLLRYHTISAVKYFNKWGWFFDKERDDLNQKVMLQMENK